MVSYLLSGDPDSIRGSAGSWAVFAAQAGEAAADIRRIDSGDFVGDEADTYRDAMNSDLPPHLETTSQAWGIVSSALVGYADTLRDLQSRMSRLASHASLQQNSVDSAQASVSNARSADSDHFRAQQAAKTALPPGQSLPEDTYRSDLSGATTQLDSAQNALQQTIDAANQVHAEHDTAVSACVMEINRAKGMRFEEPPGFWGRLKDSVVGWIKEHADILLKISSVLKQISAVAGVLSFIPGMAAVAAITGGAALGIDVTVKAATGQGSWMDIAVEAVGLIPGVRAATQAARGGAGAARAGVGAARNAAGGAREGGSVVRTTEGINRTVQSKGRAIGAARSAEHVGSRPADSAEHVGSRPADSAEHAASTRVPADDMPCAGDPINVVTGDMVLTHTDVSLPGVLPLVLRRTHLSSYRWGGAFGPSWASTLDQRIEIGADGACFLAEDGSVLYYPGAAEGASDPEWLPSHGIRRWPLRARLGGGFELDDVDTGITRSFRPVDHAGIARISALCDRNNNEMNFHYDADGVVTQISHSGGYRVAVQVDGGRVSSLRLQDGAHSTVLVDFGFDPSGNLDRVINASGAALTFHYDRAHRIVGWIDRNRIWYGYTYDEQGRCIRTDGRGRVLSYGFCYRPTRTTVTDSLGAVWVYEFNSDQQITRQIDPLGHVTGSTWDGYDRLLTRTDPLGRTIQYIRDQDGRIISVIYPDGARLAVERDECGWPRTILEPTGSSWTTTFNAGGQLLSETDPLGNCTEYHRNSSGALTATVDPCGGRTEYRSNSAGLIQAVTTPDGGRIRYERDAFSRVIAIVDAAGATTRFEWTVAGKLAARIDPTGGRESWSWDGEGNQTGHVDAAGGVTQIEVGVFDLPVGRTGPDGGRYLFGYDTELRLTAVQNPAGLRWTYQYDLVGRVVAETDFNGRTRGYEHDAAGQLVAVTNASGQRVEMSYDSAGDEVARETPEGRTRFEYDKSGRVIAASGPGATVTLERDLLGRVTSEGCHGRTVRSAFDGCGRRIRRETASGAVSFWTFDRAGRPLGMAGDDHTMSFEYDVAGQEVRRLLGSGGSIELAYDGAGRLRSQSVSKRPLDPDSGASGGALLTSREYRYRPDGALVEVADRVAGHRRRFELDNSGRITRVDADNWAETYVYNLSGSISLAVGPAPGTRREYRGTLMTRAGSLRCSYDSAGRVVTRSRTRLSRKPDTWRYAYDSHDRMTDAWTPEGEHWIYTYDPFGRRINKQMVDSSGAVLAQTAFDWDGPLLVEQTAAGAGSSDAQVTTWDYAPGTFTPIAQRVQTADDPAAQPFGSERWGDRQVLDREFYAVVTDLIGTPTELVTPDGHLVVWTAPPATAWGRALPEPDLVLPTVTCPLRFPGQYADNETGLNYNHQRYYDPEVGRYTTPDPLGLAPAPDPHRYVNNPTRWIDPLGLTPCGASSPTPLGKNGQPKFVYRRGSRSAENMTPRPGRDEGGLSTFSDTDPFRPGEKLQVIDTDRLESLRAIADGPGSHVSIVPHDLGEIPGWAATRGGDEIHPYTQEMIDSVDRMIRVPR